MNKLAKKATLYIASLVMVVTSASPAYAKFTQLQQYRNNNNVVWSNSGGDCTSSSGTVLAGNNNLEKIWNYLVGKGLNDQQAAGVLGNIAVESGSFSPFRQEASQSWGNGGYGLVQWTGSRRTAVVHELQGKLDTAMFTEYYQSKYAGATQESNGYVPEGVPQEVNDKFLAIELDFLYAESTTRKVASGYGPSGATEWEAVKAAKSLREASDVWLYSFERPAAPNSADRASHGQAILDKIKGGDSIDSGSDSSATITVSPANLSNNTSSECSDTLQNPGSVKALQELTLKYAHPKKYQISDHMTTPTDAYRDAIARAKANGQYTGDSCLGGGIDCGAFVTRLMIDSGWEPNYNFSGQISKGASNTTGGQLPWLGKNWDRLGTGDRMEVCDDTSRPSCLRPGDVAINATHTYVYVGHIEGFDSVVASASQCGKAPSAGWESPTDANFVWYRKKANTGVIAGV